MDMSQYLEIFIEETREHLQSLNKCLLQLEKTPEDRPILNEIFRVAHTLKGMSGTMGFNRMSGLTHDMEDVLHALRSNELKISTKLIDLLFKCLDALENYTNKIIESGTEGCNDYSDIIQALSDIIRNKTDTVPVVSPATQTVESSIGKPDDPLQDTEADNETAQRKEDLSPKKAKTGKTVRVDIDRLDVLLNLVSELIIQKTRLEGLEGIVRTPDYIETLEYLEKITTNLHDAVMKVRMEPVETVFNRFPRMIRDISKDLGKEVALDMSGEETELDRTVIDEIGEPLIHLLRNAVDHGIEPVEKRRELGKPDTGSIYLRAYQDGNIVVIEVEEDGQGINIEKVKKKAMEKGLISKEIAAGLSKKDIIDYLFKPSFSTMDKVTDLSGRGVGLDVVKTKIEALGGMIDVETELGKGSKFIIRLPLTLAIIHALLVLVGNEKYAIQLSSIQQITNIAPDEIKMVQRQEVVLLRNIIIPIIRLNEVLEVPVCGCEKKQKSLKLVIVKKGDKLFGLVVDRIIGQREIVQKSLGKYLSGIKIIASATILGDGNVALILDVNSLVH